MGAVSSGNNPISPQDGFHDSTLTISSGMVSGNVKTWVGERQKEKAEFRVLKISPLRFA